MASSEESLEKEKKKIIKKEESKGGYVDRKTSSRKNKGDSSDEEQAKRKRKGEEVSAKKMTRKRLPDVDNHASTSKISAESLGMFVFGSLPLFAISGHKTKSLTKSLAHQ